MIDSLQLVHVVRVILQIFRNIIMILAPPLEGRHHVLGLFFGLGCVSKVVQAHANTSRPLGLLLRLEGFSITRPPLSNFRHFIHGLRLDVFLHLLNFSF